MVVNLKKKKLQLLLVVYSQIVFKKSVNSYIDFSSENGHEKCTIFNLKLKTNDEFIGNHESVDEFRITWCVRNVCTNVRKGKAIAENLTEGYRSTRLIRDRTYTHTRAHTHVCIYL
jgi:hypothetical protein